MTNNIDKYLRIFVFLAFLALCFLGFLAPIYQAYWGYPAGEKFYSMLSHICHQYPTRCIWVFGHPTALCTRCEFGYLGISLSALLCRLSIPYKKRLLLGVLVLCLSIIDPILQLLKYYESTNVSRAITGFTGGMAVFLIIYPLTYRSNK